MNVPEKLLYTKDNQWIKLRGKHATIGITDFAQSKLGDLVYVGVPAIGMKVEIGQEIAIIESVKVVSAISAPVAGVIIEINEMLTDQPAIINQDPYGAGWIAVIELGEGAELENLLDSKAYGVIVAAEGQ